MKGLLLVALLISPTAQARVFDVNSETLAGYFSFSGGNTTLGTSALEKETNSSLSYSSGVNYLYGTEFGLLFSRPGAGFRIGFELVKPTLLESQASDSSQVLYSASSELLAYTPKASVDFNLRATPTSRSFINIGGGLMTVSMKNSYSLTTAGQATFTGVTDHTVEAKGTATLISASFGHETLLTDITTLSIEFGYRQLNVDNLKYTKDITTFDGAHVSGDNVNTTTGARKLGFSGGFISMGFRFYL